MAIEPNRASRRNSFERRQLNRAPAIRSKRAHSHRAAISPTECPITAAGGDPVASQHLGQTDLHREDHRLNPAHFIEVARSAAPPAA